MSGFSPITKHYLLAFFHSSFLLLPNICKYSRPLLSVRVSSRTAIPCRFHNLWLNPIYEKAYYLHVKYLLPSINLFFIFITFYLVILGGCVFVGLRVCEWQSDDNLWESVLTFYHMGPKIKLKSSSLAAVTFIH